MILIEAEANGQRLSTLLQNAETIKLVGSDGLPKPVTDLKVGNEVLVHLEEMARHFGMKIEESIVEQ
jgi:3-dehydroquinate synthase II